MQINLTLTLRYVCVIAYVCHSRIEQSDILEGTPVGQIEFNPRLYYSYSEEIIICTGEKTGIYVTVFCFPETHRGLQHAGFC